MESISSQFIPLAPYIDAHCHLQGHLQAPQNRQKLEKLLQQAQAAGVGRFILGGVEPQDWEAQKDLKRSFPGLFILSFGLHPWWVSDRAKDGETSQVQEALKQLEVLLPEASALGEAGLDHGPKTVPESYPLQREAFERQVSLAWEKDKPLILHIVRAHGETLEILRSTAGAIAKAQTKTPSYRGFVHSFRGSAETAHEYRKLGFYFSIGSGIFRPGYEGIQECLRKIPPEWIIVETDSPGYLAGSHELPKVAEAIAAVIGSSVEKVLETSTQNLEKIGLLEDN